MFQSKDFLPNLTKAVSSSPRFDTLCQRPASPSALNYRIQLFLTVRGLSMRFGRLTIKPLGTLTAGAALMIALSGCGDGLSDPVLDYLTSLDAATVAVRPAGLAQAGPGDRALISNGSFDASDPTAGWTQSTARTRFGDRGDLIGGIPQGFPATPFNNTNVARICGYPFVATVRQPDGSFVSDSVSCVDRLKSEALEIPAGTTALTITIDAAGRITCPGDWLTLVALTPVGNGAKVPAIQIKANNPDLSATDWKTFSFAVPNSTLTGMIGKSYQLIVQGMSGSCRDPQMEQSIVLVSGIGVIATVSN